MPSEGVAFSVALDDLKSTDRLGFHPARRRERDSVTDISILFTCGFRNTWTLELTQVAAAGASDWPTVLNGIVGEHF